MRADSQGITPEHLRNIGNLPQSGTSPPPQPNISDVPLEKVLARNPAQGQSSKLDDWIKKYITDLNKIEIAYVKSEIKDLMLEVAEPFLEEHFNDHADFIAAVEAL